MITYLQRVVVVFLFLLVGCAATPEGPPDGLRDWSAATPAKLVGTWDGYNADAVRSGRAARTQYHFQEEGGRIVGAVDVRVVTLDVEAELHNVVFHNDGSVTVEVKYTKAPGRAEGSVARTRLWLTKDGTLVGHGENQQTHNRWTTILKKVG